MKKLFTLLLCCGTLQTISWEEYRRHQQQIRRQNRLVSEVFVDTNPRYMQALKRLRGMR